MKLAHTLALALLPALLLSGCYTASSYSREVGGGPAPRAWSREGRIVSIREYVQRTQGQPGAGALAGGLIGGLLGHAITGDAGGTLFGAVGGAATGAAVSQGSSERRTYVVEVRFDDGAFGRISYSSPPPWRTGDRVRQTARGLEWVSRAVPPRTAPPSAPPPSAPPPSSAPPPPPAQTPPPPPAQPPAEQSSPAPEQGAPPADEPPQAPPAPAS